MASSDRAAPMKIISLNLNGLRSAASKGVVEWLLAQNADVVCLQETRMHAEQREKEAKKGALLTPPGWHCSFVDADTKGYSGVAIWSKRAPDQMVQGIGVTEFDAEGRWLEAQFGDLSVISLYLPSGSSGEPRQAFKYQALDWLSTHFHALKASGRRYIICGDWNIAHQNIDIKNWRGNQKNSGFLPEERAWLTHLFEVEGWVDTHRLLKPGVEEYTWWSNRGQAYAKDVGWRIDYQITSPNLQGVAKTVAVFREPRFSDHAPLVVEYAL
jgi:exodeoxyribonuclease III